MNYFKIFTVLLVVTLGYAEADKFKFDNYRLVRITPNNIQDIDFIRSLEGTPDFDIWNTIRGLHQVDVLLSPSAYTKYKKVFRERGMNLEVLQKNVQNIFDEEEISNKIAASSKNSRIAGVYASYTEIQSFMDDIVANNPGIASTYIPGKTVENRNLKVLVLKTGTSKRNVWIDCGIHAREWISPSTCIWIMDTLVNGYRNNDATVVTLLKYFEFHILPLVNPDGYEYSRNTYRMWRKNRKPNSGSTCIGTDLNRNFGYKWMTGGSSSNPCSDTYAGPSADSELETKAVEKAINDRQGRWDAVFTLHAYGLWWFTPWGYTANVRPVDYNDMVSKAQIGANAFRAVNGLPLVLGSSAEILYISSGGTEDWTYGVKGIKYSYCLELRPSSSGTDSSYGFALPASRIPAAGKETYAGIAAFLKGIMV